MRTITIKDFGPLKNAKSLSITPITILCGRQGSGKSSIAKLISTCSWIEKQIVKGHLKIKDVVNYNRFRNKFCAYHYLTGFFHDSTFIEYRGDAYTITYSQKTTTVTPVEHERFLMPQVIYIPAERNLMAAIEQSERIRRLPPALETLMTEYLEALKDNALNKSIPIEGTRIQYDRLNRKTWLVGNSFKIQLHEAASGYQAVVPIILVMRNLIRRLSIAERASLSAQEREQLQRHIASLLSDDSLDDNVREILIKNLSNDLRNDYVLSIIEEPEQNLYPSSQQQVLSALIADMNTNEHNTLIMTTHSPYVINWVTLAIKAGQILKAAGHTKHAHIAVDKVFPSQASIHPSTTGIYEILDDGTTHRLTMTHELPDDSNFLNTQLEQSNNIFDELMDIEDELVQHVSASPS